MTLDEAIKHAEEVAEEKMNEGKLLCQSESASMGCLACANEHRQLAEWLKDYKRLLEQNKEEIFKQFKKKAFLESEDVLGNEMVDSYMITDYLAELLGVAND